MPRKSSTSKPAFLALSAVIIVLVGLGLILLYRQGFLSEKKLSPSQLPNSHNGASPSPSSEGTVLPAEDQEKEELRKQPTAEEKQQQNTLDGNHQATTTSKEPQTTEAYWRQKLAALSQRIDKVGTYIKDLVTRWVGGIFQTIKETSGTSGREGYRTFYGLRLG